LSIRREISSESFSAFFSLVLRPRCSTVGAAHDGGNPARHAVRGA
jgi:hypothetical protein